ncbi:hypothetical protein BGZ63DRAFT_429127 [Mariannaea sp. PMI_226]|nr:hypothetical protein BGZ63DRAFT_429127 [Mariannaea sp. PMI_226]
MSQTPASTTSPACTDVSRNKRVLACVLCHQRKIRCERKFPCSNCARSGVQCVPSTDNPRPRRRRFPERALLDRLRKYENLLHQNNVEFEPLHKDSSATRELLIGAGACNSDDDLSDVTGANNSPVPADSRSAMLHTATAKDFWHAMDNVFRDSEAHDATAENQKREAAVIEAWDMLYKNSDQLLLGSRKTAIDLSTLQPQPAHIFRLWQIYLDNVNPLLKVTHTPTLQSRVIQAMSDVTKIDASLEALMFGIYCMSILSLPESECQSIFGFSKDHLLARYQFACQQALLNHGYLRSNNLDSLTALYLYLVSFSLSTDPRSLSSMLGIAVRIARRMGIHSEAANTKFSILDSELRRRLWWSLVLFDTRVTEKADHKSAELSPTWDCKLPSNIYDSDLWPEMKDAPREETKSTEAVFAVVRYEIANFMRHAPFYLDFSNPALKSIARNTATSEGSTVLALERTIEDKYLKFCDPENPLHFMTMWKTRAQLAQLKLLEHYSSCFSSPATITESQSDALIGYAFQMLQSDTKLTASPLTKGYHWMLRLYFPLPAYLHIFQDLRRRPFSNLASQAWEIVSESHQARFEAEGSRETPYNPLYKFFVSIVLQAWEARSVVLEQRGEPFSVPGIVADIKRRTANLSLDGHLSNTSESENSTGLVMNNLDMSLQMEFDTHGFFYGMNWPDFRGEASEDAHANLSAQSSLRRGETGQTWGERNWYMQGSNS